MWRGPRTAGARPPWRRAKARRNQVLADFGETGLLSPAQVKTASAKGLGVTDSPRSRGTRYLAFVDLVRRQLAQAYAAIGNGGVMQPISLFALDAKPEGEQVVAHGHAEARVDRRPAVAVVAIAVAVVAVD